MNAEWLAEQLNDTVARGGVDRPLVVATTPHGSYTFDIDFIQWDAVEQRVVLGLVEIVPPKERPCTVCDRPREQFPAVYKNEPQCSPACAAKA